MTTQQTASKAGISYTWVQNILKDFPMHGDWGAREGGGGGGGWANYR
jgi:hypothetical protein